MRVRVIVDAEAETVELYDIENDELIAKGEIGGTMELPE